MDLACNASKLLGSGTGVMSSAGLGTANLFFFFHQKSVFPPTHFGSEVFRANFNHVHWHCWIMEKQYLIVAIMTLVRVARFLR